MIHSNKPDLSYEVGINHLHGILRADQIRTDTLMQLVQHWADPTSRDDILDALDELAAIVGSPRREGELDAAIEQIEDVAGMDTAHVEVDVFDVRRLHDELTEVKRVVTKGREPSQGASLIKHPSHAKTRAHLAANPMPEQKNRRAS